MCRSLVKISVMLLSILNRWALRQLVYANSINHTFRKYSWQMSGRVLLRQWNNRNLNSPHLKAMNFEIPVVEDQFTMLYRFSTFSLLSVSCFRWDTILFDKSSATFALKRKGEVQSRNLLLVLKSMCQAQGKSIQNNSFLRQFKAPKRNMNGLYK